MKVFACLKNWQKFLSIVLDFEFKCFDLEIKSRHKTSIYGLHNRNIWPACMSSAEVHAPFNVSSKQIHVHISATATRWCKSSKRGFYCRRRLINMNIRCTTFLCPSQIWSSKPEIRQTALLATRSAACLWNKVWLAYSREFKVLEAMLTAIDLIALCESGCRPPRVDRGMGNSFTAVADSCRNLPNILIFSFRAFLSRFSAFSIPSRTRAGERGWQNVISNILEPLWLPNALISGRSLWLLKCKFFFYYKGVVKRLKYLSGTISSSSNSRH